MLSLCKEIVIFLLIAKLLENFGTLEKYGKFVRLIISFIVILKLITPIFTWIGEDFDLSQITKEMEERLVVDLENMPDSEMSEVDEIKIDDGKIVVEEIRWEK